MQNHELTPEKQPMWSENTIAETHQEVKLFDQLILWEG